MKKCRSLNTGSSHVLDIAMDDRLLDIDISRLTETQCETGIDTLIIESALQSRYTMHFNNSNNKLKSIAYCLPNDVQILAKEDFNGISIFNIRNTILVIILF